MKIRTRYTLMTAALIVSVVVCVAAAVTRAQRRVLEAQSHERLTALSEGVSRLAQESLNYYDQLMVISYLMALQKEHPELAYASVTRRGRTWTMGADSPGLLHIERALRAERSGRQAPAPSAADTLEFTLGFATKPLDDEVARQMRPMVRQTAAIAAFFILLGILAETWLGNFLTRPLVALTEAVAQVRGGNFDVSVAAHGGDEVGVLATKFNGMAAHIKDLLRSRENLLNALTYELSEPLKSLNASLKSWQGQSTSAGWLAPAGGAAPPTGEALETMAAAALRMGEALDGALHILRADAALPDARRKAVWIEDLFQEAAALFASAVRSKNIEIAFPPPTPAAFLYEDAELLREIVVNLVSNAVKYAPDGGVVTLGVEVEHDLIRLQVRDTGEGIPEADLPQIFAPGAALGLSIVATAVKTLGGRVEVESAPGKGSVFTVEIPRGSRPRAGAR